MQQLLRIAGTALIACSAMFLIIPSAKAESATDVLDRSALAATQASHRVLLAIAHVGHRIIAVGERGLILLSDDKGSTWRQARVPVSVTFTGVTFSNAKQGWVIGHSGTVLHTEDGGETWSKQLNGGQVGQLLLDAAKGGSAEQLATANQFVNDGPDKPFLDLYFYNDRSGIVVGAFGLILRTDDGGKSWHSLMERVDNSKGLHIYAIRAVGDTVYLAGEQGFLARSDDAGKSFVRLKEPYRGTYFALTVLPSGEVIVAGLRGNVFWSADRGAHFEKSVGFSPVSLSASAALVDGRVVFSSQAGEIFVSSDKGRSVKLVRLASTPVPLATVLSDGNGGVITAGLNGIGHVSLP